MIHNAILIPFDLASSRLSSHPVRVVSRVVSPTRQAELTRDIDIAIRILATALGDTLQLIFVTLPWRSAERTCDGLASLRRRPLTKTVLVNIVSTRSLAVHNSLRTLRLKVIATDGTFALHGLAIAVFAIILSRLRWKRWCSREYIFELRGDESKLVLQFGRRAQNPAQHVDDMFALVSFSRVRAVARRHFVNGDGVNITCGAGQRDGLRGGFRVAFGALAV